MTIEKTYTAAEVAILLEAERAKSAKPVKVSLKSGHRRDGKWYTGVQVTGDFYPVYLSRGAAAGVAAAAEDILKALALPCPVELEDEDEVAVAPVAPVDPLAPRIAPKA